MKKALNITSLVFGILGVLSVIAFLILGTVFLVSADPLARAIVDQAIQADSTVDAEALYASTLVVFSTCGTAFVVMGAIGIAGTALCFVLPHMANKPVASRSTLITLGVLTVLFGVNGQIVPGVLAIVHGAKNGQ